MATAEQHKSSAVSVQTNSVNVKRYIFFPFSTDPDFAEYFRRKGLLIEPLLLKQGIIVGENTGAEFKFDLVDRCPDIFGFDQPVKFIVGTVVIVAGIPLADMTFDHGEPGHTVETSVDLIFNIIGTAAFVETGGDPVDRTFAVKFDLDPAVSGAGVP